VTKARDLKAKKKEWLWEPYIPKFDSTMIFAAGGSGKSFLTVELGAILSRGDPWPDGTRASRKPLNILYLSGEDDIEHVMMDRLERSNADMDHITFVDDPFVLDTQGMKFLEELIDDNESDVVIIDPMVVFMGSEVDMFKLNEVRSVTGPLQRLGAKKGVTVIFVHHARKTTQLDDNLFNAFERASGSADFANATRSTIFLTATKSGSSVFFHAKTNYGVLGDAFRYSITDNGWEWGEQVPRDEMINPNPKRGRPDKAAPVHDFLRDMLKAGPIPANMLYDRATERGISKATLNRHKKGVAQSYATHGPEGVVWYWKLVD